MRHRDTEIQRILGFLRVSVPLWPMAPCLAGRVDFHGLLAAARYDRPPGFDRARKRRPISPPAPTRRVLSTGPKGLDSVFTAMVAAARKPTAAPTAVPGTSAPLIHLRRPATTAAHGLPMSPPRTPPAKSPRMPNAAPMIEPRKAPAPPAVTRRKNSRMFIRRSEMERRCDDRPRNDRAKSATDHQQDPAVLPPLISAA